MARGEVTPLAEVVARLDESLSNSQAFMLEGCYIHRGDAAAILSALRIATEYAEAQEWGRDLTRVEMARRRERFIEAFSGITLATFAPASAGKEDHDD